MDRLLGNFASDFPKCDVDRGKAIDEGAAAPEDVELLLQIEHELTNLRCIPADAFGASTQSISAFTAGTAVKRECSAQPTTPGVGGDRDDQRVRLFADPPRPTAPHWTAHRP